MAGELWRMTARHHAAVADLSGLPPMGAPEVCFGGRSNVGKSTLLNAVLGRRQLARTSSVPGRTQLLHFYALGDALMLVDLPGYGYARVSRSKVRKWTRLARDYLRGRANLRRMFLLVDSRRGLGTRDEEVMQELDGAAVAYQVVLTKVDELKEPELATRQRETEARVATHPAAIPQLLVTSATSGVGIDAVRSVLADLAVTE
ncbi:MAG: ribosome biogenesis GTP-binding protein YihA/YsxC [Rhodospirillales bacterium]|nr:ribosome biogenesis GTP-binding protein YihA/YsxC [Rhodospirillales bacterium]MYE20230.1 YihA family ribosome biogenesis GTP-binding protein [Rhodospirillales bacterium]